MDRPERIAFVKAGWAEFYEGELVVGRHAHIQEFGEAHERFNFMQAPDSRYYGYISPIGQYESCPKPAITDGWLIIVVAARDGDGPLTAVGWYENATFEREYLPRPEYALGDFELDIHDNEYSFCFSADRAVRIPLHLRPQIAFDGHFKRSPVLYTLPNKKGDLWRDALSEVALKLVDKFSTEDKSEQPELKFPDKGHIDAVEHASVEFFKRTFGKEYKIIDRQKDCCGYDFLLVHKKSRDELHVEVKGTYGKTAHFFMSRNEYGYLTDPRWRLYMVTEALSKPRGELMDLAEMNRVFDLVPYAYHGVPKVNPLD